LQNKQAFILSIPWPCLIPWWS